MPIFHDFIIVEQEKKDSILKIDAENLGIIKEIGNGYYTDIGTFVHNITSAPNEPRYEEKLKLMIGKRVLFTQFMTFDIDGEKVIVVRGRDVIKAWS